jgi:hypothetical protein
MEVEKYLHIPIDKYDEMFDQWLEESGSYSDYHIINRVMRKFDETLGIIHDEKASTEDGLNDESYRFRVIDGEKFILAVFKYELYKR